MTGQPERSDLNERPSHGERLTFTDAAERMGISPDAIRMRVRRGTLTTIEDDGRSFVVWPQPERTNARRTRPERRSERRTTVHDDPLVSQLRDENAYLRRMLDAEVEARRRADHIVAGLMDRLGEIPATVESSPVAHENAPQSDVRSRTTQTPHRTGLPGLSDTIGRYAGIGLAALVATDHRGWEKLITFDGLPASPALGSEATARITLLAEERGNDSLSGRPVVAHPLLPLRHHAGKCRLIPRLDLGQFLGGELKLDGKHLIRQTEGAPFGDEGWKVIRTERLSRRAGMIGHPERRL